LYLLFTPHPSHPYISYLPLILLTPISFLLTPHPSLHLSSIVCLPYSSFSPPSCTTLPHSYPFSAPSLFLSLSLSFSSSSCLYFHLHCLMYYYAHTHTAAAPGTDHSLPSFA